MTFDPKKKITRRQVLEDLLQTAGVLGVGHYFWPFMMEDAEASSVFSVFSLTSPYLKGPYRAARKEFYHESLQVEGEIPKDLHGTYYRNGPDPRFMRGALYHWFDGDGMVHAVHFNEGQAKYKSRYIMTEGLKKELLSNRRLFDSFLMDMVKNKRVTSLSKNVSNTDLVLFQGKLLSSWWLSGKPYSLDLKTLKTLGEETFQGTLSRGFCPHPKIDPESGDLIFMDFSFEAPYLTINRVGSSGRVEYSRPLPIDFPKVYHDLCLTQDFIVIFDFPLGMRDQRFGYFKDRPSRIGLIPKSGDVSKLKWFEFPPAFLLHAANAFQQGDRVIVTGCLMEDPAKLLSKEMFNKDQPMSDARIYEWEIDLAKNSISGKFLADKGSYTEFPVINRAFQGKAYRYAYAPLIAKASSFQFDGFQVLDRTLNKTTNVSFAKGILGNELVFAPKVGASSDENAGYLITFVIRDRNHSECWIYSASDPSSGPIARVRIPSPVPLGFHSTWVQGSSGELEK